ncbi:MAG: AAA family ATPase [Bacteroidetes bacterium]|nr:AAA family ATPase [Bacteroidota bacterium]
MKIKRLFINNYKSLVNFELVEPNPFSVFVGPNAAGKSNVFEALEFLSFASENFLRADELFEGAVNYLNKSYQKVLRGLENEFTINDDISVVLDFLEFKNEVHIKYRKKNGVYLPSTKSGGGAGIVEGEDWNEYLSKIDLNEKWFRSVHSRYFIGKKEIVKAPIKSPNKLALDCANLEPVLHRILQDEIKREEVTDWMESLIPGLDKVEVAKSDLSGDYFLRIFEKHLPDPIGKNLISDGTYNILALLTAVYQSDEPQFLCIEEPENGLNPYVVRTLVGFFRQMCEEKGHYIWLNTHSATLVRELRNEEIILIDKVDGITKAKQIPHDFKRYDLEMDEAWLTNALGGGLPW